MTARRWLRSIAALTIVAAPVVAPTPALAAPLPIGQCTTSSGVILAVDFSRWGGPLLRSCGTTPTTGYQLLNQGGWRTTGTQHDGPAFICRIGYAGHQGGTQYPTPADEKCALTPPASAYWSYWHADPGQNSWVYSQLGAMSYKPKPGSVDLWIFGATDIGGTQGRPTVSPDSVRARNSRPVGVATTAPPPGAPTPAQPGGGNPPAAGNPPAPGDPGVGPPPPGLPPAGAPASIPTGGTPTPPASPTTFPTAGVPSGAPDATPDGPRILDAAPTATAARQDTGSALPALITVGLLAVLALVGGVVGWRRRRT
ncbi:LPXTG cell wall anchor domain-containing protein [Micromonospora chokoriensis]|uniref:LPXTG-motif cell wall anchor domain-containing protein n=1 Tax=Micromonospora chokoriensis TaxID=356851 RepID=A0A1C4X9C6_9ACTN|nr:LPXTG cell wall anchor domain-containing protein [Micromonospora chokoriensis]SCF05099.1 LPXTG-motif cell wall anchor domain-containing protein [Micromonospora chokoriensis]